MHCKKVEIWGSIVGTVMENENEETELIMNGVRERILPSKNKLISIQNHWTIVAISDHGFHFKLDQVRTDSGTR